MANVVVNLIYAHSCDEKDVTIGNLCNESQRTLCLSGCTRKTSTYFTALCERERAPFAVIGEATEEKHLTLHDSYFDNNPIDLPMNVLLGKTPKMTREVSSKLSKIDRLQQKIFN